LQNEFISFLNIDKHIFYLAVLPYDLLFDLVKIPRVLHIDLILLGLSNDVFQI